MVEEEQLTGCDELGRWLKRSSYHDVMGRQVVEEEQLSGCDELGRWLLRSS